MPRRSMLFVPGNSERKLRKAPSLGADSIIIDLEDAVPPASKEEARELLARLIHEIDWGNAEVCVRINPLTTLEGLRDLEALVKWDPVSCIVVPKAETDLEFLYQATGRYIIPLIETPRGILRIEDIVRAEGVVAVNWGPADLALLLGGDLKAYSGNQFVRTLIPIVSHAYGVDPIDKVFFDLKDDEGFRRDCLEAKSLGYVGKTVIHPKQVSIANEVFTPTKDEVEWARKVMRAYEERARQGVGALTLNGELIDAVHYRIAKSILERAGASNAESR